jgi:hypothetical protein
MTTTERMLEATNLKIKPSTIHVKPGASSFASFFNTKSGIRRPIKFTHFEKGRNGFSVLLNTAIE